MLQHGACLAGPDSAMVDCRMHVFIGKILLAFVALGAGVNLLAEPSPPSNIILSSGVPGGGYWNAGDRIKEVAMSELGLSVENVASRGSRDNLQKLLDVNSPVSLAFAQADVAQYYLNTRGPGAVKVLHCTIITSFRSTWPSTLETTSNNASFVTFPQATSLIIWHRITKWILCTKNRVAIVLPNV